MGEFNSDDHYIYYCGQESIRRNGVAIMVNKRVWNAVLGCNLKNDRMISVRFQGKPFNITVIQVYAPNSNTEEAEVERFYEDLQDLLELTPKKRCPFHYRGLECKSRKSRNTWSNRPIWPWNMEWSRAKTNRVLPRKCTGHSKHPSSYQYPFCARDQGCKVQETSQHRGVHIQDQINPLGFQTIFRACICHNPHSWHPSTCSRF